MAFLDGNYLIGSASGRTIFDSIEKLPILDAHNHADVKRIAENIPFRNPWELFVATDHYVWEIERKCGVPEEMITGKGVSDHDKWIEFCRVFPLAAGNPVYEWCHLDLRFLGFSELICADNAEFLWDSLCKRLAEPDCLPQALIRRMNIEIMCSTDDPADTLSDHEKAFAAFGKRLIRPTWRPDRYMNIDKPEWNEKVDALGARFGMSIKCIECLCGALKKSHDYFAGFGTCASDHGLERAYSGDVPKEIAADIFAKVRAGVAPTFEEAEQFRSYLLAFMAELDAEKGWVFQMHIGAVRDVRSGLYRTLGPDSGGDVSDHSVEIVKPVTAFLDKFDGRLKCVLYCLEPAHQASLATVARAFGSNVRLGSAWWYNDTPVGMRRQLEYIGSVEVLSRFAGMVSDSRKLLSYASRFAMFRRVLSDVLGTMTDRGQMPLENALLIAREMCYGGPKSFFGFDK